MNQNAPRIIVLTGHGKGKTSSALGMILRSVGHGYSTVLCQFLKSRSSVGELKALQYLPHVKVAVLGAGFVRNVEHPKHTLMANKAWRYALVALRSPHYKVVVLDEICGAIQKGLLTEAWLIEELQKLLPNKIVICTGRNASAALTNIADTVSEVHSPKHAYNKGRIAQKGVEF
jgi:cob(I)alamin adenosyltransferase